MKTITLQHDHHGMKAGTKCHQLARFISVKGIEMVTIARVDRKPIKTNLGKVVETTVPAYLFDEEQQEMAA
jgi:hypothetical protein